MGLAAQLLAIRNSRWRAAVYVPVTIALAILIFLGLAGFVIFLLPFFLFAIPYWFGERRLRTFAWTGGVSIVAVIAVLAVITTSLTFSAADGLQESVDGRLSGGRVTPFSGAPNATPFNFSIVYGANDTPVHAPLVNITSFSLTSVVPENHSMVRGDATSKGTRYFYTATLDRSIHVFHFALQNANGTWVQTRDVKNGGASTVGPFTASAFDFYSFFFVLYGFQFVLAILLFFAIVGLYAWHRRNQARRRALMETKTTTMVTCPKCGAEVAEGMASCPKCGKPLTQAKGPG